jgi:hypothetical protein
MLRTKDVLHVRPLVDGQMYRGCPLTAIPGTPLAEMNNAARLHFITESDVEVSTDGDVTELQPLESRLIAQSQAPDANGVEVHTGFMVETAKYVSDRVSASLNFARNTINPAVAEIIEKAEAAARDALEGQVGDPAIEMVELPDVFTTGFLESMVSRHRTKVNDDVPLTYRLAEKLTKDLTLEEAEATIKTGSGAFDDLVAAHIEAQGMPAELMDGTCLTDMVSFNRVNGDCPFTYTNALFAYLFLVGVKSGRSGSNGEGTLTADERNQVAYAINYFGYVLNLQLTTVAGMIADNVLLVQAPDAGRNPTEATRYLVNAVTYRRWLEEQGGTPEAFLGWAYVNRNNYASTGANQSLYNAPQQFEQYYMRSRRTDMATGRIKATAAINRTVRSQVTALIRETFADDEQTRRAAIERTMSMLDKGEYTHTMQLDMYVLKAVCCGLGRENSDAYLILTTMRSLMADDDQLTPKAAALCAATRLVARWIVQQMAKATV